MNFMNIWTSAVDEVKKSPVQIQKMASAESAGTRTSANFENVHEHNQTTKPVVTTSPTAQARKNAAQNISCEATSSLRRQPLSPESLIPTRTSRPCLAGTQTMQHLIRTAPKFDHFHLGTLPHDVELSSSSMTSGHFVSSHTDPSNDSSGFGSASDGNASTLSAPTRLQTHLLSASDRELVNQILDRYNHARLWGDVKKPVSEPLRQAEQSVHVDEAPRQYVHQSSPKLTIDTIRTTGRIPESPTLNRSLIQPEFTFSTPTTSAHVGSKDLQMLEENLASAARYVEELTGCESHYSSRSSSCARATDTALELQVPLLESVDVSFSSPSEIRQSVHSENSRSTEEICEERFSRQLSELKQRREVRAETQRQRSSPPSVPSTQLSRQASTADQFSQQQTLQQLSLLSGLLSQLSYQNTGVLDSVNNELLMQMKASQSPQVPHRVRYGQPKTALPTMDEAQTSQLNMLRAALRGLSSSSGNFVTNQMLNLQAALAALSPATLNHLASLNVSQPTSRHLPSCSEPRPRLYSKTDSIQSTSRLSGTSDGGNGNSLLAAVASLLTGNTDENLANLLASTSSLTALAATLDSSQALYNSTANNKSSSGCVTTVAASNKANNTPRYPLFISTGCRYTSDGGQDAVNSNGFCSSNANATAAYMMRSTNQSSQNPRTPRYIPSYHQQPRRVTDEVPLLVGPYCQFLSNVEGDIDRAATIYRNSANNVAQKMDVACQWSGKLPMRNYKSMNFSRKVFLGGVPWDSSSDDLIYTFSHFGNLSVLWPQREGFPSSSFHEGHDRISAPKGYCYLLFEQESCVCELLSKCLHDPVTNGDYFKLSSPKFKSKDVQVIPWVISDSQYSSGSQSRLESSNTVFVGALHGMITAEALAGIMSSLFGEVTFAALDTDKHKYPIGSGRVVFTNSTSYMKAVTANFIEVRTPKFTKTLQIDPFLEDSPCNNCHTSPGIYFCRAFKCFRYFCPACWHQWHSVTESLATHKPLRRSLKPLGDRI